LVPPLYSSRSGVLEGVSPLKNYHPLPLIKGKGIKGIGLLKIKGGEVSKISIYDKNWSKAIKQT